MPVTLLQATLGELVSGNLFYVALFLIPLMAVFVQAYRKKLAEDATKIMSVVGMVVVTAALTYILANIPSAGILMPVMAVFTVMLGTTIGLSLLSALKTFGVSV